MDFDIHDTVGAWVPHGRFIIDGRPGGSLASLRFGAKDSFDVAGHSTGAGNPTWLASTACPTATARCWRSCCKPARPWPASC